MKMYAALFVIVVHTFLLIGCGQDSRVPALEAKIDELTKKIEALQGQVEALKWQVSLNERVKGFDEIAFLTPGAEGYSVVKSELGVLTVSLEDVKPYANGSKVTLRFGNVLCGTINELKAKLEWGSLSYGLPLNESIKSREVRFNKSLKPGTWTRVEVVLEGVPPTQLGFVRVREVHSGGISLIGGFQ